MEKDINNPTLEIGKVIHGFKIQRIVYLNDLSAWFYQLVHQSTGARYIHISNADKENTFGIAFKTVPMDSTGVAHILEHTVLCGSKKYPVRDPFFSMIKRSLKSFMNAFTASDWTMYPFSTPNEKDYYNLMSVYIDAVFFPVLSELSFKQEGHHLDFDKQSKSLVFKGVVYNEMKGAMSSPNQIMAHSIMKALYPQTTYGYNSGGDPSVIPDLTYQQLKAFHEKSYHPSNAFIYSYGCFPLPSTLEYIEKNALRFFTRIDPKTDIPSEPRWTEPKSFTFYYPLSETESDEKKAQFCLAWLLYGIEKPLECLAVYLIEQVLLSHSASPLRKALIESQLGSSLSDGTGYEPDLKDTMFVCGLKDIDIKDVPKIESIIRSVFLDQIQNGINKELFESALHQMEFHRKEITNSPYPYGIKLLLSISGTWFHGGDPIRVICFDDDVKELRERMAKGPYLENIIQSCFMNNPHQASIYLLPDKTLQEKTIQQEQEKLQSIHEKLTEQDRQKIIDDCDQLKKIQDQEEDVSSLPTLDIDDIPPTIQVITETRHHEQLNTLWYKKPTNGICYFGYISEAFLPPDLMHWIPLFCYSFTRIGTKIHDYTEIVRLIDRYTGGIGLGSSVRTTYDEKGRCLPLIIFHAKSLLRNETMMFNIINELLCQVDFSNLTRLKSIILEYKAGFESRIVQSGHQLAISLASRTYSQARQISEQWTGIHHYKMIDAFCKNLSNENLEKLAHQLKKIATIIISTQKYMAVIGDERSFETAEQPIDRLIQDMLEQKINACHNFETQTNFSRIREGWTTSTSVSFVARTFRTVRKNHPDAPVVSVISKLLRSLFLHKEIREKGGAYGAFAIADSEDALFHMASYRDPHIINTLNVFDNASDFICNGSFTQTDVKEAILQICSDIDRPESPAQSARSAFVRKIINHSDELRKNYKKRVRSVTKEQVLETANRYFKPSNDSVSHAIISSETSLKNANKELHDDPFILYPIKT